MKLRINLQKIITPSIFLSIFTFTVSIVLWVLFFYINPVSYRMDGNLGEIAETILPSNTLLAHIITLSIALLVALLVTQINNKYAFINTRTFIHTFLYLLISTCLVSTHGNYLSYLAALLVMYAIYLFLDNYGNKNGTEQSFLGFILLGIAVLLIPEYILLIPLCWIGFNYIKSLTIRTFFASIFGFIVPWIGVYFFVYLSTESLNYFPNFIDVYKHISLIELKNTSTIIYTVFISLVVVLLNIGLASHINRESIKTRKILFFLSTIGIGVLLLIIFSSHNFRVYIPLGVSIFSLIASYTFTFNRSLFYSIVFILLCVVSVLFSIIQLFQ